VARYYSAPDINKINFEGEELKIRIQNDVGKFTCFSFVCLEFYLSQYLGIYQVNFRGKELGINSYK